MNKIAALLLLYGAWACKSYAVNTPTLDELIFQDSVVCGQIKQKLTSENMSATSYRIKNKRPRQILVGERALPYKPENYYLWTDSYDASNDGVDDLIAIDWVQKNKNLYYLAYYVFLNKGSLFYDKKELKNFLLKQQIKSKFPDISPNSVYPVFPQSFKLKMFNGQSMFIGFSGYHAIIPLKIDNVVYVAARKDSTKGEWLIFKLGSKGELKKESLVCITNKGLFN